MTSQFNTFVRHGSGQFNLRPLHKQNAPSKDHTGLPGYAARKANFDSRVDQKVSEVWTRLAAQLKGVFKSPLTAADFPDVAALAESVKQEWKPRLAVIWQEWSQQSAQLPLIIEAMEEGLLKAFGLTLNELAQRHLGIEQYIWRSRGDENVRDQHKDNHNEVFDWDSPPNGLHPGQDYNCRCVAEPYIPYEPDWVPSTGVDYALAISSGIASGMASAVGNTLVDSLETLIGLPGQLYTIGSYLALKIEEALGTLSAEDQAELAAMDAGIAEFASAIETAFSDIPGLAEAIVDYYWAVQTRVADMDTAYRRGEATLDQLEQAVSDATYLNTQIALAIVPTSLVKGLMLRLGKAEVISADTARILKAAALAARDISPNPGWPRLTVPNLKWTSGKGAFGRALWGQGGPWEDALELTGGFGTRLSRSFRAFDFWDRDLGTATSAKTLNAAARTYREQPNAIYGRLRLYLDDMELIRQDAALAEEMFGTEILRMRMILAVPNTIDQRQIVQVLRAQAYAESLEIDFVVTIVELP